MLGGGPSSEAKLSSWKQFIFLQIVINLLVDYTLNDFWQDGKDWYQSVIVLENLSPDL